LNKPEVISFFEWNRKGFRHRHRGNRSVPDSQLGLPRLILPSVQVNMRGGNLPQPESDDQPSSKEFGYGGKLLPSFPKWLINGLKPTRAARFLKEKLLPAIYFDFMLKGREWLAKPLILPHTPADHEAQEACKMGGTK